MKTGRAASRDAGGEKEEGIEVSAGPMGLEIQPTFACCGLLLAFSLLKTHVTARLSRFDASTSRVEAIAARLEAFAPRLEANKTQNAKRKAAVGGHH